MAACEKEAPFHVTPGYENTGVARQAAQIKKAMCNRGALLKNFLFLQSLLFNHQEPETSAEFIHVRIHTFCQVRVSQRMLVCVHDMSDRYPV